MMSEIMGIRETAQYLNMKEQTIYKLLQRGKLPALKIGGQWKIKRQHLDQMFDEMLNQKLDALRN